MLSFEGKDVVYDIAVFFSASDWDKQRRTSNRWS